MNKQNVAYLYNGTLAIKGKGAVTPATSWLDREDRMLSEGSRSQGVTHDTIQFHETSKTMKSIRTENRLAAGQGWRRCKDREG